MGALPKALSRRGHRVMVVAPRYGEYAEGWETGIRRQMRVFGGDQEVSCQLVGAVASRRQPGLSAPGTVVGSVTPMLLSCCHWLYMDPDWRERIGQETRVLMSVGAV